MTRSRPSTACTKAAAHFNAASASAPPSNPTPISGGCPEGAWSPRGATATGTREPERRRTAVFPGAIRPIPERSDAPSTMTETPSRSASCCRPCDAEPPESKCSSERSSAGRADFTADANPLTVSRTSFASRRHPEDLEVGHRDEPTPGTDRQAPPQPTIARAPRRPGPRDARRCRPARLRQGLHPYASRWPSSAQYDCDRRANTATAGEPCRSGRAVPPAVIPS